MEEGSGSCEGLRKVEGVELRGGNPRGGGFVGSREGWDEGMLVPNMYLINLDACSQHEFN